MTKGIITGNALRDWDPAETKAIYWSGACQALVQAMGLYGCKTLTIRDVLLKAHTEAYRRLYGARTAGAGLDCDWNRFSPEQRAWYSMGAADALSDVLDALPDSVIEHHPGGLKSLHAARRRWIAENQRIADNFARKAGLLK